MEQNKKQNSGKKALIILGIVAIVAICGAFFLGRSTVTVTSVPAKTANANLMTLLDYGDSITYVIGHQSPDTDTVMSAIAMANLLNKLGIQAEARVAGKTNGETNYVLDKFGISKPELLSDATDAQLWLVDHSEYAQAVSGAEQARIVGIIDHHGIGDVSNSEQIYVNSAKAGATVTLIWKLYKDCGIEIDKETAEVMLGAILSDSSYLAFNMTDLDTEALEDLKKITGISDVTTMCEEMKEAKIAYKGMSDSEIFYNDYKNYTAGEYIYGIGNISVKSEEEVAGMEERMEKVMQEIIADSDLDFLIAMVYNTDHTYGRSLFVGKDQDLIKVMTTEILKDADEYTGVEGNTVIFKPSVSRKTVVVPRLEKYLKELKKEDNAA